MALSIPGLVRENLATARGTRLRLAREMAGLTRKEMQDLYDVNQHSLRAWENGQNTLKAAAADKLVLIFLARHIKVSRDWLLFGVEESQGKPISMIAVGQALQAPPPILDEICFFLDQNSAGIVHQIHDTTLMPAYQPKDFVGGVQVSGSDIVGLIGETCIITLPEGDVVCKKIFKQVAGNFLVGDTNVNVSDIEMPFFPCKIVKAARITRLWRAD